MNIIIKTRDYLGNRSEDRYIPKTIDENITVKELVEKYEPGHFDSGRGFQEIIIYLGKESDKE